MDGQHGDDMLCRNSFGEHKKKEELCFGVFLNQESYVESSFSIRGHILGFIWRCRAVTVWGSSIKQMMSFSPYHKGSSTIGQKYLFNPILCITCNGILPIYIESCILQPDDKIMDL